jgi:eukaryotic translation initiation factor 2C
MYEADSDYEVPESPIIKDYDLPDRRGFATVGNEIQVSVNAYPVTRFPTSVIHQYDCSLGADGSKRALIKKLWNHPQVQSKFGRAKSTIIFDGSKLAWSVVELPIGDQLTLTVDLDEGSGRPRRTARDDNKHRVVIRKSGAVPLQVLGAYLEGKTDYDNSVVAGINFLDHLIRETPAKKFVAIKRSFFQRAGYRELEGGVEAWKGIFQSIRVAEGGRLIMNVDTATCCFWQAGTLMELAINMIKNVNNAQQLSGVIDRHGVKSIKELRRLKKVQFFTKYRKSDSDRSSRKTFTVEGFEEKTAKNTFFDMRRRDDNGNEVIRNISVADYYLETYNIRLNYPGLPLVKTRKAGIFFPLELCYVVEAQRYPFKLNEKQTADMIKFTVQRPQDRLNQIKGNVGQLDWKKDPILREYGLEISPEMFKTTARILPVPTIEYGQGSQERTFRPVGGRWDLRGKKFFDWGPLQQKPGMGLKSWGVMVFESPQRLPEAVVKTFFRELIKSITVHGGQVVSKDPVIMYADWKKSVGINTFELYKKAGNKVNQKPQLLFFILSQKASQPYNDIKSYCDTHLGIPSQCMQSRHVEQAKAQYCSNICMKINAKVGGSSNTLPQPTHPLAGTRTMLIGADVSHASPGSPGTSFASMVGSTNMQGTRFAAIANTNGTHSELISGKNIFKFIMTLLRCFKMCTNHKPDRIVYFRDGVSEGQYGQVIRVELEAIKQACRNMSPDFNPTFTVVICSKRHHFRIFPTQKNAMDRNGNPLPGTIIERAITHPTQWDFYLNSHNALQGTARPVHYHVIWDENKFTSDKIQALIYNTCYTYIRATCSVSLVPATYYAHIASARARCHENDPEDSLSDLTSEDPKDQKKREMSVQGKVPPLKELHQDMRLKMWFV